MALAIGTAVGRAHEERGRNLLEVFAQYLNATFVPTPPTVPATLDGVLTRRQRLLAVVECKTRGADFDLSVIRDRFRGEFLLTEDKLDALRLAARMFGVPGYVVVGFSCGHSWVWRVAKPDGSPACRWRSDRTSTRSDSIGGGSVIRLNAFLPLNEGHCWQSPTHPL